LQADAGEAFELAGRLTGRARIADMELRDVSART
jgi:hypothetical protein